ncbi:hypothetical protein BV898_01933 [Hypsibius exemplaris]|uniref:Uncharacterized protein n=1 Tax=Hypsibius exemplaris TaxID=2072580 RepID=A0A1W0XAH2_HYPEX|nr:hypothetical protein BV898_01933 [Hypsibius exemplaris]
MRRRRLRWPFRTRRGSGGRHALVEKDPMIKAKKPRAAPGVRSKPRGKDAASTSRGGVVADEALRLRQPHVAEKK